MLTKHILLFVILFTSFTEETRKGFSQEKVTLNVIRELAIIK